MKLLFVTLFLVHGVLNAGLVSAAWSKALAQANTDSTSSANTPKPALSKEAKNARDSIQNQITDLNKQLIELKAIADPTKIAEIQLRIDQLTALTQIIDAFPTLTLDQIEAISALANNTFTDAQATIVSGLASSAGLTNYKTPNTSNLSNATGTIDVSNSDNGASPTTSLGTGTSAGATGIATTNAPATTVVTTTPPVCVPQSCPGTITGCPCD